MICKAFLLCALVAVSQAQLGGYGHGHGHAVSSQSIVRHETPIQHHKQPVLLAIQSHHAPIHSAPKGHAVSSQSFVSHHTPVHHAPIHHAPIHHIPIHHAPIHHAPILHVPVHHAPVHHAPIHKHVEEYAHPAYKFEYSVHDDHTKDIKSQSESRDGDVVHGHYSLLQPDGHIRNVNYHADKHSGFNAEVTYTHAGHQGHGHQGYN
ncbi:uncharacterized protein LOC143909589 [Arctopsyche grandis]|uniref:uncharacterized protein LOC143909589 n=1 Tax=Arctopsyche grandis TaxID=121162 RepID=UPI00406D6BB2